MLLCALVALCSAGACLAQSTASAPASAAIGAGEGKVITLNQTLTGKVSFDGASFIVGPAKVPWSDVLIAIVNPDGQTLPAPHAVILAEGEMLCCQVLGLSNHKLSLDFLGKRELREDCVSALLLNKACPPMAKPKTLYRLKEEPIPGTLVWIYATRIALDSPLGALTIPRKSATGYSYFSAAPASSAGIDEVHLLAGRTTPTHEAAIASQSVLRGRAEPAKAGIELEHALLGKLALPMAAIRSLRRSHPSVGYVSSAGPVTRKPLIGQAEQEARNEVQAAQPAGQTAGLCPAEGELARQFFSVLKLQAGEQAEVGICQLTGRLRATVLPAAGSRGTVRVRVETASSQPRLLKELTIEPKTGPTELAVDLPELTGAKALIRVSVELAGPVLLPAGAVLADPMVVSR